MKKVLKQLLLLHRGAGVIIPAPENLTLTITGAELDVITADWDAVPDATDYEIEYSDDGVSYTPVDTPIFTTYDITDADYNPDAVTHYVRVRAIGGEEWAIATISGLWVRTPHGYLLDEAITSGTRIDTIGSGDLTDNSDNTNYTTGKFGNAARFTAIGWLDNTSLSEVSDFAITGWVYFPGDTNGGFLTVGHPSSNSPIRSIRDGSNWVVDKFFAELTVSGLTHGAWHFLYVGYDMSARTLYASIDNGTQVSTTRTSGANDYPNAPFNLKFLLGVADGLSANTVDMDNFYIRTRIPSAAQLAAEYNSGNGVVYPN